MKIFGQNIIKIHDEKLHLIFISKHHFFTALFPGLIGQF